MTQALKVTYRRLDEMQKDPQEYFRMARELALIRAAQQLEAEQQQQEQQEQRAKRSNQAHFQAGGNISVR